MNKLATIFTFAFYYCIINERQIVYGVKVWSGSMQVQSVNQKSNVNFQSDSNTAKAAAFVNLDDSQLRIISHVSGRNKKKEQRDRNSLLRTLYAIPVVDTIASAVLVSKNTKLTDEAVAALRKTKLSTRVKIAARTAGFWAVSLTAIELYNITKRAIQSKSPTMKKIDRENPATSFLLDLTAILGGGALAASAIDKYTKNAKANHPEKFADFDKNLRKAKLLMNRSKFNQETLPKLAEKMAKFAETNPWGAKTARLALAHSVLIIFGIGILKMFGQAKSERSRVEQNYRNLKETQLKVSKHLISNLTEEKKELANEVSELKEAAEKKAVVEEESVKVQDETSENIDVKEETEAGETNEETEES